MAFLERPLSAGELNTQIAACLSCGFIALVPEKEEVHRHRGYHAEKTWRSLRQETIS